VAYEYDDKQLCLFASQKHYISLYLDTAIIEKPGEELKGLNVGKICIHKGDAVVTTVSPFAYQEDFKVPALDKETKL
jgi:hypothetical protein